MIFALMQLQQLTIGNIYSAAELLNSIRLPESCFCARFADIENRFYNTQIGKRYSWRASIKLNIIESVSFTT